jgi:hypothetical protein
MKDKVGNLKGAARSGRGLRTALSIFGVGAVASLGLFAAGLSPNEAPAGARQVAPVAAVVAPTQELQPIVDSVDWARAETVPDPGPMAIGASY